MTERSTTPEQRAAIYKAAGIEPRSEEEVARFLDLVNAQAARDVAREALLAAEHFLQAARLAVDDYGLQRVGAADPSGGPNNWLHAALRASVEAFTTTLREGPRP